MLVALFTSVVLAGGFVPTLTIEGSCPGSMTVEIDGATPDGTVAILRGDGAGADPIPGGPCRDVASGLTSIGLIGTFRVDGLGDRGFEVDLGESACSKSLQVLDLTSCGTTDAVALGLPPVDGACAHLTATHEWDGSQGQWCSGDALLYYRNHGAMTFDDCQCLANATGTNWFGGESTPFPTVWIGDHDEDEATLGSDGYWADEAPVPRDALYDCVLATFDHRTEPSESPIEETYLDASGRNWHFWRFTAQTHSQVISFADDVGGRVINPNSVGFEGTSAFTQPTHWCHAGAQFNGAESCNSDSICNFFVGYFD